MERRTKYLLGSVASLVLSVGVWTYSEHRLDFYDVPSRTKLVELDSEGVSIRVEKQDLFAGTRFFAGASGALSAVGLAFFGRKR